MQNAKSETPPAFEQKVALRGDEKSPTPVICVRLDKCPYRTPGNIYELDVCPTCEDNAAKTHLSTLIQRVCDDENSLAYVTKEHLVNLAEYIVGWQNRYTQAEYHVAIQILAHYHLAHLASINHAHARKYIAQELDKAWTARCKRCGLPISAKVSILTGYGHICRRKLGIPCNGKDNKAIIT